MLALALPDPHLDHAALFRALLPLASLLLIGGFWSAIVSTSSPRAMLITIAKFATLVALIANFDTMSDFATTYVQDLIVNQLHARPDDVASQYLDLVADRRGATQGQSFWSRITSPATSLAEAMLATILFLFSLVAGWVQALAYLFQKLALQAGYGLCPLFLALLGIGTVRSIGVHYILGVAGVILWPLGWAVASLVTADLLAYVADQSLLPVGDSLDTLLWSTRTFLTTMLIGIWILFTTFAAPVVMHRAITTGANIGTNLLASGFATIRTYARV